MARHHANHVAAITLITKRQWMRFAAGAAAIAIVIGVGVASHDFYTANTASGQTDSSEVSSYSATDMQGIQVSRDTARKAIDEGQGGATANTSYIPVVINGDTRIVLGVQAGRGAARGRSGRPDQPGEEARRHRGCGRGQVIKSSRRAEPHQAVQPSGGHGRHTARSDPPDYRIWPVWANMKKVCTPTSTERTAMPRRIAEDLTPNQGARWLVITPIMSPRSR